MKKFTKLLIIGLLPILLLVGYYFYNRIILEGKVAEKERQAMEAEKELQKEVNKVKLEDCLNGVSDLVLKMANQKEKTDVIEEVRRTSEDSCYAKYR